MKKHALSAMLFILFLSTALVACSKNEPVQADTKGQAAGTSNPPAEVKPITLSVGLLKLAGGVPLYLASEKGFFKEEGITVDYKWFDSSNAVNVAVASNNVDVGAAGFTADLYNMVAAGQKVSIVADKGKEEKGYQLSALLVHKDSPIKTIEDLKGKKIGLTTIGSSNHYMSIRILEKHGMTVKDAELVPMNTTRGQMEALKGKNVDAIILNTSNITVALKEGYARVLANVADEMTYQSTGTFISPKFAENKDAAVRFLRAYVKGMRYYHDAVLMRKDGQLVKGQNYDEVVKIVAKYTEQPEDIIRESFPYMDRDGKLMVDDIQTQIDWYTKEKLMPKPLQVKDIVNTELLDEALKTLKN
ncbi:ABC transporter substrate-binding protein [Paenibacillus sp. tmac-D7]|uniref:ABC transporter substrate-binding protein n=1 Tax=Paenibacillus sp. tmac-D7 TaxID=2591462 RepID=UPI0011416F34|nr:ABC transporter substrate-binding protein [Paenibacillus sp. tmac-D7]